MSEPLSPSAKKVQEALARQGFSFQVQELSKSTRTAQDAANAVCCNVKQIIKSLIFRGRETNKPVLVLASGSNRVDEKKVSEIVAEPIEKADADYVRTKTGFVIGGVPPVGHDEKLLTLIDEDLLSHQELWAAAGTPNALFKLKASDLGRMTDGRVVSIK